MAYQTGTATDLDDLVSKLFTFATANGWTSDQLDTTNNQAALHRNNVYVSFRWSTAAPNNLGVYQALGYTGGNQPGTHPNDSGNGAVSGTDATIANERYVALGNGPFPSYAFFLGTGYIHVVVEKSTDVFRHFGFGELVKFGNNWTGGEYCYGMHFTSGNPVDATATLLLDGLGSGSLRPRCATVHVEGLPGQGGTGKWGGVSGLTTAPGNDTAGVAQVNIIGGFRSGPIARQFGVYKGGSAGGLIPTYPIGIFYLNVAGTNAYYLGYQPDARALNIESFAAKDEVTIGSDVWQVFPAGQKTSSITNDRTYNQGICYKKV